jgi:hypothetical protein
MPLKIKGEQRQFIHEAEDLVVFLPNFYKIMQLVTKKLESGGK